MLENLLVEEARQSEPLLASQRLRDLIPAAGHTMFEGVF